VRHLLISALGRDRQSGTHGPETPDDGDTDTAHEHGITSSILAEGASVRYGESAHFRQNQHLELPRAGDVIHEYRLVAMTGSLCHSQAMAQ
jgi:hypothetical protein